MKNEAKPQNKISTKDLAISAVLLAIAVAALYAGDIFQVFSLTCCGAAGALVYICASQFRVGMGWLFFAAASILSLLIVPDRIELFAFYFVFGPYGVLKYIIDNLLLRHRFSLSPSKASGKVGHALWYTLGLLLKLVSVGILVCGGWFIFRGLMFASVDMGVLGPAMYAGFWLILMIAYDWFLTLVLRAYALKIRPKLKK